MTSCLCSYAVIDVVPRHSFTKVLVTFVTLTDSRSESTTDAVEPSLGNVLCPVANVEMLDGRRVERLVCACGEVTGSLG
jgi:hypothetical protein